MYDDVKKTLNASKNDSLFDIIFMMSTRFTNFPHPINSTVTMNDQRVDIKMTLDQLSEAQCNAERLVFKVEKLDTPTELFRVKILCHLMPGNKTLSFMVKRETRVARMLLGIVKRNWSSFWHWQDQPPYFDQNDDDKILEIFDLCFSDGTQANVNKSMRVQTLLDHNKGASEMEMMWTFRNKKNQNEVVTSQKSFI